MNRRWAMAAIGTSVARLTNAMTAASPPQILCSYPLACIGEVVSVRGSDCRLDAIGKGRDPAWCIFNNMLVLRIRVLEIVERRTSGWPSTPGQAEVICNYSDVAYAAGYVYRYPDREPDFVENSKETAQERLITAFVSRRFMFSVRPIPPMERESSVKPDPAHPWAMERLDWARAAISGLAEESCKTKHAEPEQRPPFAST